MSQSEVFFPEFLHACARVDASLRMRALLVLCPRSWPLRLGYSATVLAMSLQFDRSMTCEELCSFLEKNGVDEADLKKIKGVADYY